MKNLMFITTIVLLLTGTIFAQSINERVSSKSQSADNLTQESVINVAAPYKNVEAGSDFTVPVTVSETDGRGIIAYQFDLHYDPTVIRPQANAVEVAGTVSNRLSAVYNPNIPGLLKVAVYGAYPLSGAGVLLNFKFTAIGPISSTSQLAWVNFMFNEGNPSVHISDGLVKLIPKSNGAVPMTYSGRETIAGSRNSEDNLYRDNTFVLVSDDQTNATSMTVTLNLAAVDGQPGSYNIVSGHWTLIIYSDGRYTGSIYGEITHGPVFDTVNAQTGEVLQRRVRGYLRRMGGLGCYDYVGAEDSASGGLLLETDYTNAKTTTGTFYSIF